jgi:aspartyl-tRNA(Asn)/glutamyl-tRNA(Gln) amidotransferase subunit B
MNNYTPIVGLEIHVELKTKSKMFCACDANHFQVKPNTHTCPVCLGLPGALPIPNQKAIHWCQLIGLALNCTLAKESKFDRKNYFYPDLAKGYQISQYDQPLCINGHITLSNGKKIGITRVHMEEDTGKNVHKNLNGKKVTLVDFNRSGVPLVEIVTEPDFNSKEDIDEFLKHLRKIIRFLQVSDADMEKGSMRLELNMSLKSSQDGDNLPKYKVEVKNINSFRYLQKAFDYELTRQSEILGSGNVPAQETRGYQEDVNKTISQRSKEEAQDYRYFPEPDIPPMVFTDKDIKERKKELPLLPSQLEERYKAEYKLDSETIDFLTQTTKLVDYFSQTIEVGNKNNLTPSEIAKAIKNKKLDWEKLTPTEFITQLTSQKSSVVTDQSQLESIIKEVLSQNPDAVQKYKSGKTQIIGFLIGEVMKKSQGKADPKSTSQIMIKILKNL